MFATEYGAASLVLREIPYRQVAYIRIQDSLDPGLLLEECVGFCRAVGAEQIYASGHEALEGYPFHTAIWQMRGDKSVLSDTDAALWPVQENTLDQWLAIYNRKAVNIPNAAWMSHADGREMLRLGDGYFVHRGDTLLGIGRASGGTMRWVASCYPKAGVDVVRALAHAISEDTVYLEVASENRKAIEFYKALGFVICGELSRWYKIL